MQKSMCTQLNEKLDKHQKENCKQLLTLAKSTMCFVRQNMPLQGDSKSKGNLFQSLETCRSINDCDDSLKDGRMHSTFQHKFTSLLAKELTSTTMSSAKTNKQCGTIEDEATDISNTAILTLACSHSDDDLDVKDHFTGTRVVSTLKVQLQSKKMVRLPFQLHDLLQLQRFTWFTCRTL